MAQWTCSQQTRFDYHCHPWFISGLRKSIWQSWSDSWCHSDCFQPWETSFICRHCWVFEHNIKRRLLMKFLMVLQMMQKLRKKNLLESLMRLQSTNSHLKTLSWGSISCSLHQHIHTSWVKKRWRRTCTLAHNFTKYWLILKIFPMADIAVNL